MLADKNKDKRGPASIAQAAYVVSFLAMFIPAPEAIPAEPDPPLPTAEIIPFNLKTNT